MAERNHRLIDGKLTKYLLPSVMMTMAMQLGAIVDTMLVGNLLGTQAMSAIRLCMPVMTVEQVVGYGLGTGAAIAAGTLLGQRDKKGASSIFSSVFRLTLVFGMLFTIAAFFLTEPLAQMLSGGGDLAGMTRDYLFIWMLGGPVIGLGLYLMNFMGVESKPGLSSAYIIVSNVVNLILDYVFLAFTPLGITGAALSTMIGYLAGMVVYIRYFVSKDKVLTLKAPWSFAAVRQAAKVSIPTLVYMGMSFVEALGSNLIVNHLLGENGVAVYTVCTNVMMITLMVTGGIIGVIPSLAGVLYGEKDYYGLRAVCVKTLKITSVVTAVLLLSVLIFTEQISGMFGINQEPLLSLTVPAMRCFMFCLPFYVWNKFLTSYYQCINEAKQASLITFLEYGAIQLPAAFIGISIGLSMGGDGFNAMGLSFVISEALTALASAIFRKIKHPGKGVFILPKENSGECLDLTIAAASAEVPSLVKQLYNFGMEQGVESTLVNRMTVAAEEMTENIIAHGGKSSEWIDICFTIEPDILRMRIRDNGIPFDPTAYKFDGDLFDIRGIEIVKRIASTVSYVRAIDLNNTVIEVKRNNKEEDNGGNDNER